MDDVAKAEKPVVAIVGTGLIGCSMAEGLRETAREIVGVDNNTAHLQEALYKGWIDKSMSLEKVTGYANVIIVSVPVDASLEILPGILDGIAPGSTVIDAGSIKGAVCRITEGHANRSQFVAAHPMAGLAQSGPDASDSRIFRNRNVIVCEKGKSSVNALEAASGIFEVLGMNIVYMDPDLHDLYVARVSHLPQVLAYSLSSLQGDTGDQDKTMMSIASTGYESATRLSSSPADMWIPIFMHNQANLSESLDEMITSLSEVKEMITMGEWISLRKFVEKANKSRELFISAYKQ